METLCGSRMEWKFGCFVVYPWVVHGEKENYRERWSKRLLFFIPCSEQWSQRRKNPGILIAWAKNWMPDGRISGRNARYNIQKLDNPWIESWEKLLDKSEKKFHLLEDSWIELLDVFPMELLKYSHNELQEDFQKELQEGSPGWLSEECLEEFPELVFEVITVGATGENPEWTLGRFPLGNS